MSTTISPSASVNAAITAATTTTSLVGNLQSAALNGARGVPEAAQAIAALDPALNAYLQGKSALGSKTLIAPLVTHALTWAVGYYGLGWDPAVTESVAGLLSVGLMAGAGVVTSMPITAVFPKPPKAAA